LVLARIGILRAAEIKKWPNRAVVGPQGEDSGSSGLSHRNTLRLGLIIGDRGERRCISGFDACYACIDASLSVEFERQLSDERDQDISCRRSNCGIRRSAWCRRPIEGVGTRATVNSIEGIVDGYVHHCVDTRFVEWIVEGSDTGRSGSHTGVCVPDGDCVAAGRGDGDRGEGYQQYGSDAEKPTFCGVPVHEIPPFVVWGSSHFSTAEFRFCLTAILRHSRDTTSFLFNVF
jgi:hypothetical protein